MSLSFELHGYFIFKYLFLFSAVKLISLLQNFADNNVINSKFLCNNFTQYDCYSNNKSTNLGKLLSDIYLTVN